MTDTIEAPEAAERAGDAGTVDPVTTEVLRNFFSACAEDMNAALFRSAYSSIIYEGRDCAVALLDAEGSVLGMSTGVPIFLGNLEVCVRHTLATRGREWFAPGDVVIMNDPYLQGSHMHDFTVFGPIFHGGPGEGEGGDGGDGELVGFAASRAHWQDVGAITTGTTMGSTEVYQEGFRLAPTKVVERYQPRDDWFDFLERNSRFGTNLIGDLNAQIAACRVGERRVGQVLDRVGLPTFLAAKEAIFRQAEVLDREAIAALPDGTYRADGFLDDDGAGTGPLPVVVTVTIDGDSMLVDLDGTHPQVQGPVNCGLAQTVSAIRLGYRLLVNTHVPITGGSFPTLDVRVPDDCLFNAREPAACEWYFSGLGLLADLMVKALAPAVGDRAAGAHYGDSMVIGLDGRDPRRGGAQFYQVEPTAGGWGGHAGGDGESALINLTNGSFKNIPVEVYETASPVRIEEFSLRPDTGGPGRHRGGCGVTRVYRMLADGKLSVWFERSVTPAWGIDGGQDGVGPEVTVDLPDGTTWEGLKVSELDVPAGSVITIRTGGGGGWGPPTERDPEAVARDVREGYVTPDAARLAYGITLST